MEEKKKVSRGIRNNNPGNIRISTANNWIGKIEPNKKKDSSFEEFKSMPYGVRAMMKLLQKYQRDYKLNTVKELITKWAPEKENNTAGYIASVCWSLQCSDSHILNLKEKNVMCALVNAMIFVENGEHISMKDIESGWDLM